MSGTYTPYKHPDGFTLGFSDNTLIATDDNGNTVSLPMGLAGLTELGNALLVLAAEQDEKFTSECAGALMGRDLINELLMLRGKPQCEAVQATHAKLHALSQLEHSGSAAGGFAGAVVNVLEIGIANLPKFEREGR